MGDKLEVGQPIRVIRDSGKELAEGLIDSIDEVTKVVTVKLPDGSLKEFSGDKESNHGFYKVWGKD